MHDYERLGSMAKPVLGLKINYYPLALSSFYLWRGSEQFRTVLLFTYDNAVLKEDAFLSGKTGSTGLT